MTVRAILSDLHGNLEASRAALKDAQAQGATEVICLGDVVNYGPDPAACLSLTETFTLTLRGNNEQALLGGAQAFRPAARRALEWTRDRLLEAFGREALLHRLERLPLLYRDGPCLFVHGSPRDPINEYLSFRDVQSDAGRVKLNAVLARYFQGARVCFCGHTHAPGLILESTSGLIGLGGADLPEAHSIGTERVIAVAGAVGLSAAAGPARAAYLIHDTAVGIILFRRVDYPVHETAAKALRELFLWEYACRLMNCPATPEAARALSADLHRQNLLRQEEVEEINYFLRLAKPEDRAP